MGDLARFLGCTVTEVSDIERDQGPHVEDHVTGGFDG